MPTERITVSTPAARPRITKTMSPQGDVAKTLSVPPTDRGPDNNAGGEFGACAQRHRYRSPA